MITLSKNGNAIRFTFVDNGHYLFNGTIDVPINSLSLITDESEMATFKKSATNDTFISALYSDFGMSKSELETWYMNNMVGSSGSGSGGTTPEEVQQMIDESISGLAESSAVTLEISEAVSGKADSDSLATVATSGSYNDLLDKPTIPDVSNYFDGAEYDSGTTRINFYHGNTVKAYIDASAFVIDGMVDDVRIEEISGVTYLVIDFNTASGKEDIQIPLTDIFDPSNYYTKSEVDDAITAATDDMATQTWVGEQGYLTEHQSLSAYSTTEEVNTAIEEATSGKADTSAVTAVNDALTAHTSDSDIHVTVPEKMTWNAKSDFSGSYNDLTDKPTIPTVPTNVSDFNNDAGYITSDALSGYAESSAVTEEISAAVSGKVDTTTYTAYTAATDTVLSGKLDASAYTPTDLSEYWTSAQTESAINAATSGKADTTAVTTVNNALTAHTSDSDIHVTVPEKVAWNEKQDALVSGTNIKTINNQSLLGSGNITIQGGGSGSSTVELTQAEYDALVSGGTVDPTTYYIITDATPIDINNYVATSAITSAVTSASTDSEIPTAKAVWEAASGGGTTYSAGRGIDITNDTISVSLPISGGTGGDSIQEGYSTQAYGEFSHAEGIGTRASGYSSHAEGYETSATSEASHAEGYWTIARGFYSHAEGISTKSNSYASHSEGYDTIANNLGEHASGRYNLSSSASTDFGDSGNTLFSVGNGNEGIRHNTFEIRQTGEIFIADTNNTSTSNYWEKPMIKLQDSLGGGGITSGEVQTMIDESISGKQDTMIAGTNITISGNVISAQLEGGTVSRGDVEDMISAATSGLQETLVSGTNIKTINNESILGSGNITIQGGGGVDSGTVQTMIDESISGKVDTSAVTTSVTSASTDSEIPTAKAVYDATQSGGGGGTTYSAGTNISIENDTISCTLPISAVTGDSSSIYGGYNLKINGNYSVGFGYSSKASPNNYNEGAYVFGCGNNIRGDYSFGAGTHLETTKNDEITFGRYSKTNGTNIYSWGLSANTLFSIGNGNYSTKHNAFEVRQNGDIYIADTNDTTTSNYWEKPMIKLQDNLGGGSVSSAVTSGDTNAVSSDAVYTAMGGLKLQQITQADYDALVSGGTVDASTLYIITNVVN